MLTIASTLAAMRMRVMGLSKGVRVALLIDEAAFNSK
jgi:hypothetical protein